MESSIESASDSAIGAAKGQVKIICKTILPECGDTSQNKYDGNDRVKTPGSARNVLPAITHVFFAWP